jgi:hypothetical protein
MTDLEILKAARETLSDENRRTNYTEARNCYGIPTDPCDPNAMTWDATGALLKAAGGKWPMSAAIKVLAKTNEPSLQYLNDNHSPDSMLRAFDAAIAAEEIAK